MDSQVMREECACGPYHNTWNAMSVGEVDWDTRTLYHGHNEPCGGDLHCIGEKALIDEFYKEASLEKREWIDLT